MALFTRRNKDTGRTDVPQRALLASAERLRVGDPNSARRLRSSRQTWQEDAWGVYDDIGEVKYAVGFKAHAMSRLRWYAAIQPDPNESPIPIDDPKAHLPADFVAACTVELDRLHSLAGGPSQIFAELASNLDVAGEGNLLGLPAGWHDMPGEQWTIASVDELVVRRDGTYMLKATPKAPPELLPPDTFALRIWQRHPRFSALADSPLRGVLESCEELLILSRSIRAAGTSRIAGAGVFGVAQELSFGSADPTQDDVEDGGRSDPFARKLYEAITTAIKDEGSASAVAPLVIRGPLAAIKDGMKHITFDRPLDEIAVAQRSELLKRIGNGLDLPAEIVTGMADLNHWTAWLIDESVFRSHLEPLALLEANAVTVGYWRPAILAHNAAWAPLVEQVFIHYDETELVTHPSRGQDAKDAHAALAISDETLRHALGFTDSDAPTDEEITRRMAQGGAVDPNLTQLLLMLLGLMPKEPLVDAKPITVGNPGQPKEVGPGQPPAKDTGGGGDTAGPDKTKPGAPDEKGKPGAPDAAPAPPPAPAAPAAPAEKAVTTAPHVHVRRAPIQAAAARRVSAHALVALDADLRTRLSVALDAAMRRCIDRAGNKLTTKARRDPDTRDIVAACPSARLVAQRLGRDHVHRLGYTEADLTDGAFDEVCADFAEWAADTATAARAAIVKLAADAGGTPLPDWRWAQIEQAWATHIADAGEWLHTTLHTLAARRLYDPHPQAPEIGEWTKATVPPNVARIACTIAGGGRHPTRAPIRAWADTPAGPYADVPLDPIDNLQPLDQVLDSGVAALGATGWASQPIGDGPLVNAGDLSPEQAVGVPIPAGGIASGDEARTALQDAGLASAGYVWVYGPFPRTNPFEPHVDLDGVAFANFDDDVLANNDGWPDFPYFMPGDHDGCFPAGTVVSGPAAVSATLRHWQGEMVKIGLASGQFLAATPNHPILTRQGWVPIGELAEGDDVVCCGGGEGITRLVPNGYQMPTRIEDVADTFRPSRQVSAGCVPVPAEAFHGDGAGSEIAVVRTDRRLRDRVDAALGQPAGEDDLGGRLPVGGAGLAGQRGAAEGVDVVRSVPFGVERVGCHRPAPLGRPGGVRQPLRLGDTPDALTGADKAGGDRAACSAERLGQSLDGLAGLVAADKVVHVERYPFTGQVFNLDTRVGWYVAQGVIVHNCVCDFDFDVAATGTALDSGDGDMPTAADGTLTADDAAAYAHNGIDWAPSMTADEADQWAEGSAVSVPLYHGTTSDAADAIIREGFDLSKSGPGGDVMGAGVYGAGDRGMAESYADALWGTPRDQWPVLETRVNVAQLAGPDELKAICDQVRADPGYTRDRFGVLVKEAAQRAGYGAATRNGAFVVFDPKDIVVVT